MNTVRLTPGTNLDLFVGLSQKQWMVADRTLHTWLNACGDSYSATGFQRYITGEIEDN